MRPKQEPKAKEKVLGALQRNGCTSRQLCKQTKKQAPKETALSFSLTLG
jgi:hypothetical protein